MSMQLVDETAANSTVPRRYRPATDETHQNAIVRAIAAAVALNPWLEAIENRPPAAFTSASLDVLPYQRMNAITTAAAELSPVLPTTIQLCANAAVGGISTVVVGTGHRHTALADHGRLVVQGFNGAVTGSGGLNVTGGEPRGAALGTGGVILCAPALRGDPASIEGAQFGTLFLSSAGRIRVYGTEGRVCEQAQSLPLASPIVEPDTTLKRFQQRLAAWRGCLLSATYARLNKQLSLLLEDEEDIAELSRAPATNSFEELLSFLSSHLWIKAPALTLTRDGIFCANWRPAPRDKARISVDFEDDAQVRWSAVDVRGPKPSMVGGVCSVSELDEHLRSYRDWLVLER